MKTKFFGLCLVFCLLLYETSAQPKGSEAALVDTGLVAQPVQFSLSGLAGAVFNEQLTLKNFTASALQVTIAESLTASASLSAPPSGQRGTFDMQSVIRRLRSAFERSGVSAANFPRPAVGQTDDPDAYATIITDDRGENILGAADVYRVQHQLRTFLGTTYHDFRIILGNLPDTNVTGFISIDTDQDFGTGAFPTPFGLGPTSRDVGSEREVFFDASGVIIDSLIGLGRIPAGIVLSTVTDTIVGTPFLLSITRDSVTTVTTTNILQQGIRAEWLSDPDGKMNVAAVAARYTSGANPAPDYAPVIAHGVVGSETGISWLSEDSTSIAIPAGDSVQINVTTLAARLPGTYNGLLQIKSPGRVTINVPATLNVTGIGQPHIVLSATGFSGSVPLGDSTIFDLNISNTGNADLVWGILDSSNTTWVSVSPAFGNIVPSSSGTATMTFRTAGLVPNNTYTSQLLIISNDPANNAIVFPLSLTVLPSLGVSEEAGAVPKAFELDQNYPNPFNPSTNIGFRIADFGLVSLKVFDVLGRETVTLVNQELKPGNYTVNFDAAQFASGVYFYRLTAGSLTQTGKLVLMK